MSGIWFGKRVSKGLEGGGLFFGESTVVKWKIVFLSVAGFD